MANKKLDMESILIIGRTYGRTAGRTELSKQLGVSKQKISQIAAHLRRHGVPIPKSYRNSFDYKMATEILLEELKQGN